MTLDLKPPLEPMEAMAVDAIPGGDGWQYEPKWDGFRCLVFRDGSEVALQSKSGQPLARYFPEMAASISQLKARRFVLDGELAVPVGTRLSFDQLLLRIHPAESRVRKLAAEHPAMFIAFDLLADEKGVSLLERPLVERRKLLERFAARYFGGRSDIRLSPATTSPAKARRWFKASGGSLDGILAKRLDAPYRSGDRSAMQKVKPVNTVDCVVGGFRYASKGRSVGSLLLGLYDEQGLLHHVGYTSSLRSEERRKITPQLEALEKPPGFTGRAPGGKSRWSTERSTQWQPLAPKLVVEVEYDQVTAGRFRHGVKFVRWRPDKAPRQCRLEQIERQGILFSRLLRSSK
jgi:ATP-dependent DNA ligase